ncbi:MAG: adenylyl-sulfate kinase [Acidimicrobiia bacterium]|nr:adenylyl-sulfate kinase [Acidimicrobiia bacterium]
MSENLTWHDGAVSREQRERITGGPGVTIWLTGLPGSGKSSVADGAAAVMADRGRAAYTLDGDNIRHGLNAGLGFSVADRAENVRRIGEVARLMADAGLVVLVPVISPYRRDRAAVRQAHGAAGLPFGEVHVATPLAECERRDPKGLYVRARRGELPGLTGVDDPYEDPVEPECIIGRGETIAESVEMVVALIDRLSDAGQ